MAEFIVDTNIASYILDGELWERAPSGLMRGHPELHACWKMAQGDLLAMPSRHDPLHRSIVAYEWFKDSKPTLVLLLTAQTELSVAPQVRKKKLCHIITCVSRLFQIMLSWG